MGLLTFKGGIHPKDGKALAKDQPIKELLPLGELVYPLSQHIGAPAVPLVKKGDHVLKGQKIAEASSHIIHLHGELTKVTSSWEANNPAYIKELKPEEYEIHLGDLAGDGSQFRPFIVWFGESVPMIETAIEYAETADIFLIIGTSLNVYPAAGLLNYVPANTPVYLIDPKQVPIASGRKVHVIQKGASEGMEELKKILVR